MVKKWVRDAINPKHKGDFAAKAEKSDKSTLEYAVAKEDAPGKLGKQARLAESLIHMNK